MQKMCTECEMKEGMIIRKMIEVLKQPDVRIACTKINGYTIFVTMDEEEKILKKLWKQYIEGIENHGKID